MAVTMTGWLPFRGWCAMRRHLLDIAVCPHWTRDAAGSPLPVLVLIPWSEGVVSVASFLGLGLGRCMVGVGWEG